MMSLDTIRQMSDKASRKASRQKSVPYVPYNENEIDNMPSFPFPFLGNFCPKKWVPVGEPIFVDSSGWGADDELALSVSRFKNLLIDNLKHGYGYGIIEQGQFQVYVQAYLPK